MSRVRIRGAQVVLDNEVVRCDVMLEGTKIADVDPAAHIASDETLDAHGLHLLPGVIDDQVHFRDPGFPWKEDLYSGSRACAKGGVTTYLEMPNTNPATISQAKLEEKLELGRRKSMVNYGFYIGATPDNVGELKHAHRTPGIKIFIGSSTGNLLVDQQAALERIFAETTLPITAHCEDEATIRKNREAIGTTHDVADHSRIRDVEAAVVATRRAIDLAQRHEHHFHVLHVSTAAEVELIRAAGPHVSAEACLHHLFFDTTDYEHLGTRGQMNPSLKSPKDREGLWNGLADGVIEVIATDHAPHTLDEKAAEYPLSPSGVPAVENSLALMLDSVNKGRATLTNVARWMSSAPARIWRIRNKGRIQAGYDADLVLVDMNRVASIVDETQVTRSGWSPWHGTQLQGWPVRTFVMGRTVYADGKFDDTFRGCEALYD